MHPAYTGASACFFFAGRSRRAQNDAALMEFFVTLYSVKEKVPQFVSIAQRIWYDELGEIKKSGSGFHTAEGRMGSCPAAENGSPETERRPAWAAGRERRIL